jgi:hypothetical protein
MRRERAFAAYQYAGVAAAVATAIAATIAADAKVAYDSPYSFEQTYNAAMRLVRVDMGYKVVEKDDQMGYLLFDYRSPESGMKASPGSIELVRPRDPAMPVHVMVQLPQMPRYHEQVLLDALVRKMREEYGDPPTHRPSPAPSGDAGAD